MIAIWRACTSRALTGLDSQFHFPLMWALRGAIASEATSFEDVAAAVLAGEEEWRGSGAVMATMIGNHDVTRFASESTGDAAGDPWQPAKVDEASDADAIERGANVLLHTLLRLAG